MSARLHALAAQWLAEGRPAVVVEVTEARGSVPRGVGTRMLVAAERTLGTIGGGHLELDCIDTARGLLGSAEPGPHQRHYPLGPALGQCCGGAVTMGFFRLDAGQLARWQPASPLWHLQLYGAGHVGRAIARLLVPLDVTVDWIDEREDEFPARVIDGQPWPGHIRRVSVDAVDAEVDSAPPGGFYLVLTHSHDLDLRITEAILRRGDFAYLGLIGSKSKRQRFIHRFERRGIAADVIARMTCPIGVPGIAGKAPEMIAVAVVAQLLQVGSGRTLTPPSPASP